jgi:hypothetical protein
VLGRLDELLMVLQTQQIFYEDDRVLFISLHQDSNYPLHSGGSDQWGMSFLPHSSPPTGGAAVDHPGGGQSCRELLPLAGLLNYVFLTLCTPLCVPK